jgi:putative ABC transport system substrate-binding protein
MIRREFITLIGGAAAALSLWPMASRAQQRLPVIGFLYSGSFEPAVAGGFRQGLGEAGYVEGRNVLIEYHWADGRLPALSAAAADLVSRQVNLIFAGGAVAALAAKAATASIPIVFDVGDDPVRLGLVASINRPGGNITGVYNVATSLTMKMLEQLHKVVPAASVMGCLLNPDNTAAETITTDVEAAARALGVKVHFLQASNDQSLNAAFSAYLQLQAQALIIYAEPFLISRLDEIVAQVTRLSTPSLAAWREFALMGGLMSYGPSRADTYRQAGIYAGRILRGDVPAGLPVMQPTKFELVINLKTARTLGLTVPDTLIALADEVIE